MLGSLNGSSMYHSPSLFLRGVALDLVQYG
jgi:hypothetical protein